jgi:hypothetical protein
VFAGDKQYVAGLEGILALSDKDSSLPSKMLNGINKAINDLANDAVDDFYNEKNTRLNSNKSEVLFDPDNGFFESLIGCQLMLKTR